MSTNTITLHPVLWAPPERIYRAFLHPGAMAEWLPPEARCRTFNESVVGGQL